MMISTLFTHSSQKPELAHTGTHTILHNGGEKLHVYGKKLVHKNTAQTTYVHALVNIHPYIVMLSKLAYPFTKNGQIDALLTHSQSPC
jgi:hypothetical protein